MPGGDCEPNDGDRPQRGSGGEPLDVGSVAQDGPRAEEADARYHLGGDAPRVAVGHIGIELHGDIDRNGHCQAGADGQDGMRAQPGRLVLPFTFVTDDHTQEGGQSKAQQGFHLQ